jgi:hypothetical protein
MTAAAAALHESPRASAIITDRMTVFMLMTFLRHAAYQRRDESLE